MCLDKKLQTLWKHINHQMSEKELIEGCIKEDRNCQMELYKRFSAKMMAVCLRYSQNKMEAEDMLQEGFIKVFDHIAQFKQQGSLEGWVRRIMVNTSLNKIRQNKMEFNDINSVEYHIVNDDSSAIEKLSEKDLLNLINDLPKGYKYVFNMYAIEGYSHKEIAESLGIEEASSRSQYAKAKKYLQEKIYKLEKINI